MRTAHDRFMTPCYEYSMPLDRQIRWDDLEAFRITAAELNFTRAARRLHLTQPGLSRRIQRLEAHLGTTLFERTTRRVELTPAGRQLLAGSTDLQAAWDRVSTDVGCSGAPGGDGGTEGPDRRHRRPLRVSAASLAIVRLEEALAHGHPEIEWRFVPFDDARGLEAVASGDLDLAMAYEVMHGDPAGTPATPSISSVQVEGGSLPSLHMVDEPVWLAVGLRTAWADYQELSLDQLADETWIARSDGPLRRLFDEACQRAGFAPKELEILDNNWPIRRLVAEGRAVTLCAGTVVGEDLAVVPLLHGPHLRYRLAWSPRHVEAEEAEGIHRTVMGWYRTESQRSRRYWAHILSNPGRFPAVHSVAPPSGRTTHPPS